MDRWNASSSSKWGIIIAYLFALLMLFSCPADTTTLHTTTDAEGAVADVKALLEFKKHITHDPLSLLQDWDPKSSSACNWTGIKCSTKHLGRVVQVYLESATLRGRLSPHVANLSFLQVLDVYNNSFFGQIPSSIGQLHRLKILNLCLNFFQGALPPRIGNLSSLQHLILCDNSFVGEIPPSLVKLHDLNFFNVLRNRLSGRIPSWLGALHKLEFLDVGENSIHGVIPPQLGNLTSLEHLGLGPNPLTGFIPCSLARLYRLEYFYLTGTNVRGSVPNCLCNLTNLNLLNFNWNNFQGQLPACVGCFHKLQYLGFTGNQFTGSIPQSWANITQLQSLNVAHNKLGGPAPSWLGRACSELEWLRLGQNYFTSGVSSGTEAAIPILEALSNCPRLIILSLHHNMLTGTLPPNIGNFWPRLQRLHLSANFISGDIPKSIGNLTYVFDLRLSLNMFRGRIPSQITGLKSVQALFLQSNKLSGHIPVEISLLNRTLAYLYLSNNKLTGSIPSSIGELINLRGLRLSRNLLSGTIPSEIGNCHDLEDLILSANNFTGSIPSQVAVLSAIVFNFDLSNNGLSGEVPPEIAKLDMAQFINLSSNKLSGEIAPWMDSWLDARVINLTFNKFHGNLSTLIGNKLTQLQSIDLAYNNFTGTVPESLLNHSHLQFLNFSYNDFDNKVTCFPISSKLKLSRWSFLGNPRLCGRCFGLKACQISIKDRTSHPSKDSVLRIVLGILGGLLLLAVSGTLFFVRRIKTFKVEVPNIGEKFLKLSVEELCRITENFSALNLIGEGTHGKVYRGVLRCGQMVAVKCFSSASQSMSLKSFRKECRALAKVKHRNILKIITVVWSQDLKAVVMPFMSNGNLHSLLHAREEGELIPLRFSARLRMLTEMAGALCYLHHNCNFQIIHCDIKPENVLLDDDMTVKFSDFGIAHLIGDTDNFTISSSSGGLKGSVGYIAPDMLNFKEMVAEYGIGENVFTKGDVYSFGVLTLEVIARLKPTHEMFSGDLTLPLSMSMTLQGKSGEERKEGLKDIIKKANECGGGIDIDNDNEMVAVDSILKVGLRCTSQDAHLRPTMKEVESLLHLIQTRHLHNNHRAHTTNLDDALRMVELQPPLYPHRMESESSTLST